MNSAANKSGIEVQIQSKTGEWEEGIPCFGAAAVEAQVEIAKGAKCAWRVISYNTSPARDITAAWT